jgi:hypothetical protein
MTDINTFYLFVFIFSTLTVVKTVGRIISSLFANPPKPIVWDKWELIFLGLAISYCLTFIIKN